MEAAAGAGYTNVHIDGDGVRRRIFLTRKVGDYWYLQLAFAPLMAEMGNPAIELFPRKLVVKASGGDITIPLDAEGAMLIDWPKTNYKDSYVHESFAKLAMLDENVTDIRNYLANLETISPDIFPAIPGEASAILALFDEADAHLREALDSASDESYSLYTARRDEALGRVREGIPNFKGYAATQSKAFIEVFADDEETVAGINDETDYATTNIDYMQTALSAYDKLDSDMKKVLAGKTVIIGRTDTGTTDIGVNPFDSRYINVGTHAAVLDTVISRSFITPLDKLWSMLACLILVPLLLLALTPLKPAPRVTLGILAAVLVVGVSFGMFALYRIYWRPLGPALAILAAVVVREAVAFNISEKEKQFIRNTFSTYLSGDVVQEILQQGSPPSLGGEEKNMSAIFTDIRGFSTVSEALSNQYGPQEGAKALVRLLNRYLSAMSDVVLERKGVIDKYEGDAIIAFFGAPQDLSDHALRACTSAIHMKRIEDGLNKAFAEEELSPSPLYTRIGINTGSMVVGNMGTQRKMDYTSMGNAVNLAARLEGVNKQYGTWILATGETVSEAGDSLLCRRLDRVRVVGINEPVRLHNVMEIRAEAPAEMVELRDLFEDALNLFEEREWEKARAAFARALKLNSDDEPSKIYYKRSTQYLKEPPPDKWEGVYNLNQK
jgi:adenylate cyclase